MLRLIILIMIAPLSFAAKKCSKSIDSVPGHHLLYHVIEQSAANDSPECLERCIKKRNCSSINYRRTDKHCELNNGNKISNHNDFAKDDGYLYMDNPEKVLKKQSCLDVKMANPSAKSGNYEILVRDQALTVYCDMETYGGGWTLVATASKANHDHLQANKHNCLNDVICVPFDGAETRKLSDDEIRQIIGEPGVFRLQVKYSPVYDVFYQIVMGASNFSSACTGSACPRIIASHHYPYQWESNCKGIKAGYVIQAGHYVFDTVSNECGSEWISSMGIDVPYRGLYGVKGHGNYGGVFDNRNGNLFVR